MVLLLIRGEDYEGSCLSHTLFIEKKAFSSLGNVKQEPVRSSLRTAYNALGLCENVTAADKRHTSKAFFLFGIATESHMATYLL